jgi:hypothetical protein
MNAYTRAQEKGTVFSLKHDTTSQRHIASQSAKRNTDKYAFPSKDRADRVINQRILTRITRLQFGGATVAAGTKRSRDHTRLVSCARIPRTHHRYVCWNQDHHFVLLRVPQVVLGRRQDQQTFRFGQYNEVFALDVL